MTCSGPCNQGRLPCPTPEACELTSTYDRSMEMLGAMAMYLMGVVTGVFIALILF